MIAVLRTLLFCVALVFSGTAFAQDAWQQGRQAYERGDFATAARHLTVAARAGNQRAALSLGFLYDNGWGVVRDGATAQELYIAAAPLMAMAKNNLAYLWARQNGLLKQALCLSAQTLAEEPDNAYYLDTYGFILLRLERAEQARAYFAKAIRILPDYADALEHLGDVAAMTGAGTARDYWRRAQTNPRDERQNARVQAKLGGAPGLGDVNQHPPFKLRDPGLPKECGMPSV
ncbi:MAG: pilF [Alphaproteobacteria bacterium]|jgi:tetratricopeptide (TPR) repeat protein|nr:pilF [Alphaproteobacteria bacterium]